MAGVLGIKAYWPVVCIFILVFSKGSPGFNFTNYTSYVFILIPICTYGIWGLVYSYINRSNLVEK